ncbi:probable methyltransferase-like protein 24 isoform X1 [Platichthys flesus]|uniref:probable methyltransferase-like protein 24 isoform X1 n=1 Tax=Platichthys flesus TaxID=8260 RepID=UPI002DB79A5E|nr:probable methyltransferase-like protein 24 isoform X1 [Platichthys flesus]
MDMGRERPSLGLLLRVGVLLTGVCVCVHVILETGWSGTSEPLGRPSAAGRPVLSDQNLGQQSRTKRVSAEVEERDRSVKKRISYVRTLKKESPARKRDEAGEAPSAPLSPHRKTPRWHIDLEPWASESHSLEEEAKRFLSYITTPQVVCSSLAREEAAPEGSKDAWAVCLDPKYSLTHKIQSKHCRIYSFGLGEDDRTLERSLASAGCEVHCFDPGLKQLHLQEADMWLHRLSVDWRDPNPAVVAQRQHANTKKLATILNDFGHRQVDVLKADMESAEWKILENLVLEGVLDSVGQMLLEVHLHWAGFEVGGDDPSVVRYWFSLLKELERADFRLFHVHSDPAKPHLFLHKNVLNASSVYTLSWVNTRWRP